MPAKISVVIPVLNEAETIQRTIFAAQDASNIEIIVVDGGSVDETVEIARKLGLKVLFSHAGRAKQMNSGAKVATGEILLFLHGDTRLPTNYDYFIREALAIPKIVAGAFELNIEGDLRGLRFVEKMVKARSRFFSLPYGDQAIFLQSSTFRDIGGFKDLPIMEDFELIQQLKKRGKITLIPLPVITSGRRWQKLGVFKTTLINQLIILGYSLGISPSQLARWYRRK